jgi:hypothetical protein
MSIKLDWEVSDAPSSGDQPTQRARIEAGAPVEAGPTGSWAAGQPTASIHFPVSSTDRPRANRLRPLVLIAALAAVGGASLWAITSAGWRRVTADVGALVSYEDQLARQGEADLVLHVQDPGNPNWLEVRRAQLRQDLPAPLPVPMLNTANEAAQVESVVALDGDFVAAAVRRTFQTPDGRPLSFVLPQIYRRDGSDDWKRTTPPGYFWGQWTDWRTAYLHVRHSQRDASFVMEVAPRLEAWIQQACDLWSANCAGVLPARLYLSGFVGALEYNPLSNIEVRVEFGEGDGALPAEYFLSVPSPQLAGIPTEPAGQAYLAEYLAVRLIASLAARSTPHQPEAERLTAYAIQALGLSQADPGFATLAPDIGPTTASVVFGTTDSAAVESTVLVDQAGSQAVTLAWVGYTIQPGDTLFDISIRYDVSVEEIVKWNNIPDPDMIVAGSTLQIPIDPARLPELPGAGISPGE